MDNKTVLGNRGVLERAYCNIAVTCNALVLCILIAAYTISALQEHDYFSAETQSVIHTHTHRHTHTHPSNSTTTTSTSSSLVWAHPPLMGWKHFFPFPALSCLNEAAA